MPSPPPSRILAGRRRAHPGRARSPGPRSRHLGVFGQKTRRHVRVIALGVLPEYRKTGLDVCFYVRNYQTALLKGIKRAEASWILENNDLMNRALLQIDAKVFRKHRIYEKAL